MKVILTIIMLVCAALVATMVGLIYDSYAYGIPETATPLKTMLENYGLNLLGDSLAGIMALVTLLVVAGSFAHQIEQSKQTVKEMKEQNAIAKAVADANVKSAWFHERYSLYEYFKHVSDNLYQGVTYEKMRDLSDRLKKVRFVFGEGVSTQGLELFKLVQAMKDNVEYYENVIGSYPPIQEGDIFVSFGTGSEGEARTNDILNQLNEIAINMASGPMIVAMEKTLEQRELVYDDERDNANSTS